MLKKVTIFGERCSGTNYLEQLLITNFDVEIIWDYGWKHFFGFCDLNNSDDVLFIGIVRNLPDWINSLYNTPYHLPVELIENIDTYLNKPFYSVTDDGVIMTNDINIETNEIYKNIFELRHVKNKYLVEKMPLLVNNYLLITYDELIYNFNVIMNKIKNGGLQVKNNIEFPINYIYYKNNEEIVFQKQQYDAIDNKIIFEKANLFYEKILFPNMDFK